MHMQYVQSTGILGDTMDTWLKGVQMFQFQNRVILWFFAHVDSNVQLL